MDIDAELQRIKKHFKNISREELNEGLKRSGAVVGEINSIQYPVFETNKEIEIKLSNLGTTMYKKDGTFKGLTELLDDIGEATNERN